MNEWELLQESEGIEKGNLLNVERENGKIMKMRFTGTSDGKFVLLKDGLGETWHFSMEDLSEIDGQDRVIIGKFEA